MVRRGDRYTCRMTDVGVPAGGQGRTLRRQARREISEPSGFVDPKTTGRGDDGTIALLVRVQVPDQPGVLHELTRVIFEHRANITYVDIMDQRQKRIATYFELSDVQDVEQLVRDLEALPIVREVERAPSF